MNTQVFFFSFRLQNQSSIMSKKKKKSASVIGLMQTVQHLYERKLDHAFSIFGMSNEQFRILQILEGAPPEGFALKEIQKSLPNQTANTTRLVDKLNQKNYITKKSAKADKRELRINLTEQGIRALQDARAEIKQVEKKMSKSLKSKNVKLVVNELEKMKSVLEVQ